MPWRFLCHHPCISASPSPSDHLLRPPASPSPNCKPAAFVQIASIRDSPHPIPPSLESRAGYLRIRGRHRSPAFLARIGADSEGNCRPRSPSSRSGPVTRAVLEDGGRVLAIFPHRCFLDFGEIWGAFGARPSRALDAGCCAVKTSSLGIHGVPQPRGQLLRLLGFRRAPRLSCPGRRPAGGARAPRVQPPAGPVLHIRRPQLAAALRRGSGSP